jgi:hypothetical protein
LGQIGGGPVTQIQHGDGPGGVDWSHLLSGPITGLATLAMMAGAIFCLAQLIIGAISIMNGDSKKIGEGRAKIVWACVGLLILASSFAIMMVIQDIMGTRIIGI